MLLDPVTLVDRAAGSKSRTHLPAEGPVGAERGSLCPRKGISIIVVKRACWDCEMLTGLHVLTTYNCNFECVLCFLDCRPGCGGTFTFGQSNRG